MPEALERWTTVALIAVAGGAGALCRHGITLAVGRFGDPGPATRPLATLAVNTTGCFLFGLVWAATAGRGGAWTPARLVVLTGFLGAFTTFSTYGFEVATLLRAGRWPAAAGPRAGTKRDRHRRRRRGGRGGRPAGGRVSRGHHTFPWRRSPMEQYRR